MRLPYALFLSLALCAPAVAQDAQMLAATDNVEVPITADLSSIVLHDGQLIAGDVRVMPSVHQARYVLFDGERVELSEIKVITTPEGSFGVVRSPQLGTSMLVEQTTAGRISVYEEGDGPYASGLKFIQKDDGPMLMMNQQNLRSALADDPESLRHLQSYARYQKIGTGALIAGGALVATGAALHFSGVESSGPATSPIIIASSGVLLATAVNFAIPMFQQGINERAVAAYNR